MPNYYREGCPWCDGEVESKLDLWEASMAFSTFEDEYFTCTECTWSEHKPDERSDQFTFTE